MNGADDFKCDAVTTDAILRHLLFLKEVSYEFSLRQERVLRNAIRYANFCVTIPTE